MEHPAKVLKSKNLKVMGGDADLKKKSLFKEKQTEKKLFSAMKDPKKHSFKINTKYASSTIKAERDYQRIKTKYNVCIGNILKEWLNLIYCILILRMNLIKLALKSFSKVKPKDIYLQKQILFESKIIYNMIKSAQFYSQKQFFHMWTELEKLISNRTTLRNALKSIQMKDDGFRNWKTAAANLAQVQDEFVKNQNEYEATERSKTEAECAIAENSARLEIACSLKEAEYKKLIEIITELKKKEVQMRGKILLNMKNYKDLKNKRQNLLNVANEMKQLKSDQDELSKEYSAKIQMLKNKIEEMEKQIMSEKEEKRKIKINIKNLGDVTEKNLLSL